MNKKTSNYKTRSSGIITRKCGYCQSGEFYSRESLRVHHIKHHPNKPIFPVTTLSEQDR